MSRGLANGAVAAVDDPFLLDTDPVQPEDPAEITFLPVPEPGPGAATLTVLGLAALRQAARRRRAARAA